MVSPTKWLLSTYSSAWLVNDKTITITTDRTCHLWVRWTSIQPTLELLPIIRRGIPVYCKPTWHWHNTTAVEQSEPGDTLTHTFSIPDWSDYETRWYYFHGTIAGLPSVSNTPPFQQTYIPSPLPPGPFPTPVPVSIPIYSTLNRNGKRYIWWYDGAYYILLPTATSLTIWSYDGASVTRLDSANEPTPPVGTIQGADSRLSDDGITLHIAYNSMVGTTGDHYIRYVRFRLDLQAWGASEPVVTANAGTFGMGAPLLELGPTPAEFPICFFVQGLVCDVYARERIAGVWGASFPVITIGSRNYEPNSAAASPIDGSLAVIATNTNAYRTYRRRSPLGVWSAEWVDLRLAATDNHSSIIYTDLPHTVCPASGFAALEHRWGNPPSFFETIQPAGNIYHPNIAALKPDYSDLYTTYQYAPPNIYASKKPSGGVWSAPTVLITPHNAPHSMQRIDHQTLALVVSGTAAFYPKFYAWQP